MLAAAGSVAAVFALASPMSAAIAVGPGGAGPLTFEGVPLVSEFATGTNNGDATIYFDRPSLDVGVAALSAASVTSALPTSGTVNPSTSTLGFRYNTTLKAIQSRPTTGTAPNNCAANLLLATFQNDSGASRSSFVLSYDFNLYDTLAGELPGFNVYYSLSGEPGGWQPIEELTGNETVGNQIAVVSVGSWPVGSPLYLLWVDDNANAITDPSYTIDNLQLRFSVDLPVITNPPVASLTVTQTQAIRLSVGASGSGVTYRWAKDGVDLDAVANPTARQATLIISNAALGDSGRYVVTVGNPSGAVASGGSDVTVLPDVFPPSFVRAAGDAADPHRITLEVSEPLCLDGNPPPVGCGGLGDDPFSWQVAAADGSGELQIDRITVNGTQLTFELFEPRDPAKTYRIIADPSGFTPLTDTFGNGIPPGTSIEVLPAVIFRQGINGYAATRDVELRGAAADVPQEGAVGVTVDTDDGGGISHGLLRFEHLFGTEPGQIPPGADILSATLTLQHNVANANGNPVQLHRMLIPWDAATVTYNSLGAGVQADGAEAAVAVDATVDSTGRAVPFTLEVNVTSAVQDWAGGQPNYGWAFLPTGTDGYRWDTSESPTPPALVVVYSVPPCTALTVVTPPASATVNEGAPINLSVVVRSPGCPASFQWRRGGVNIPGATNPVYSVISATPADAGAYDVVLENSAPSSVVSGPATVVVQADLVRPVLTRAVSTDATTVILNFSKALAASAQDVSHYAFTPAVAVTGAALVNTANGATVTLTTASREFPAVSTLRITGLTDNRTAPNLLNPNPTEVVLTGSMIVEGYATTPWQYATNSHDGINWTSSTFIPGPEWMTGTAFFGTEDSAAITNALPVQPNPIATPIAPNNNTASPDQFVTAYFRRNVVLPTLPAGTAFALCHWTDDGAVFYLDGVELARYNMPAGRLEFVTRAAAGIEASMQSFIFTAAPGAHTLAVEVHQGGATTSDGLFGAEIRAVTLPPALTITTDSSGTIHVRSQADASWQLQSATDVTGAFAPVANGPLGTHDVAPSAQGAAGFFRLQYRTNP